MDRGQDQETTDVVICGCGPTGAMLSGYLCQFDVRHVVLEREADITTDPRGIALDEDGIRLLQGLGVYDKIFTDIGTCMNEFRFVGGRATRLSKKPFITMDFGTTEGGTGHVGYICHKQPELEKHLRLSMKAPGPDTPLRSKSTVTEISSDDDWVYCRYVDAEGVVKRIRSRFLVGADGKTGFTRKRFLEERGIKMETVSQSHYNAVWVALNWQISLPDPKTHPDFPLWRLGYTPEQVYDEFFPKNFRFLCNPRRPAVCGRFGPSLDRLWRFEFVVLDGEDGDEMSSPKMINKIVRPYLRHSGSRYGLAEDVEYPFDCINVLRCRPFNFSARSCNRWSDDRVLLCGDAAHVFPPFGGQGIASGFRDAVSLAWRLALAVRLESSRPGARVYDQLFRAWYLERKQQLETSLATTVRNGDMVTEANPFKIFMRDWYLWFMQLVPSWQHQLSLGPRANGMAQYTYESGMPFLPSLGGGRCFPQVYSYPMAPVDGKLEVCFTDDVIWRPTQMVTQPIFRLILLLKSVAELDDILRMIKDCDDDNEAVLRSATVFIEDTSAMLPKNWKQDWLHGAALHRIASADEFAASRLCIGRPSPKGYDAYRMGIEMKHKKAIILRPDRFVFAACETREELKKALKTANDYLDGTS